MSLQAQSKNQMLELSAQLQRTQMRCNTMSYAKGLPKNPVAYGQYDICAIITPTLTILRRVANRDGSGTGSALLEREHAATLTTVCRDSR